MRTCLLSIPLVLLLATSFARADDLTADQILERARRSGALGLVGSKASVRLVMDDGKGTQQTRALTASAIDVDGEVRRLVRFHEPADVRGVGLLSVEKGGRTLSRQLYLPAQKRVRRVSGRQGGQSFMNTDFAYADLDLAGGEGDRHKREADQKVDGNPCWVVATVPADSPYGKVVTYVHQQTAVPLQALYYDADGKLAKRLKVSRVKQVSGKWYAFETVMETLAKGTKTTLSIDSLDTQAALSRDDYTEQALERL